MIFFEYLNKLDSPSNPFLGELLSVADSALQHLQPIPEIFNIIQQDLIETQIKFAHVCHKRKRKYFSKMYDFLTSSHVPPVTNITFHREDWSEPLKKELGLSLTECQSQVLSF